MIYVVHVYNHVLPCELGVGDCGTHDMYTIGQLARRVGMPTSTLRYYEKVGLLEPSGRTEAGYRIYDADAEQILTFIHRAQRIGFSLSDIRHFLTGKRDGALLDETVADIAERRYLEIERQLTDWKVLQHERYSRHLMSPYSRRALKFQLVP